MGSDRIPGGSAAGAPGDEPLDKRVQAQMRLGDLAKAQRLVDAHLAQAPEDAQGLYLLAVVLRYRQQVEAASQTLDRLLALQPNYSRAHQEQGHLLRASGRADDAIQAYSRACHLNPALLASWRALHDLLLAGGQTARAQQVGEELARYQGLPKPLLAAQELVSEGRLLKAERLCREFLQRQPRHVEGMRLLARIALDLGVLDDADLLLESAVAFEPDHVAARIDYITALRKRQQFTRAQDQARELLARNPDDLRFQSIYAVGTMQSGHFEDAIAAFDRILDQRPGDPITLTSKGHALKTSGRYEPAVDAYTRAIEHQPTHGEAWYALANLKTYRFTDRQLDQMRAMVNVPALLHQDRIYLSFALGKALEDRGAHEQSFYHYAQGNEGKRRQSRYDADRMHEDLIAQRQLCTREFFRAREGYGADAPDPIFIVGLPRAGSTLLEQILASHSQVDGTLELPNILALSQQLRRRPRESAAHSDIPAGAYPAILADLPAEEFAAFGDRFLEDTRIHRQGAPRFIDKMPNNFRHIGLIHLMLPRAKIIDARREPMACCFSGYKQLFAEGQEFSYSLTDIARYYLDYVELMAHWDTVLPGKILRVRHEDVVEDLDGQVRRLLAFCELPFEDACTRYWETSRAVRTPSSEQVRRPIDREATAQWQPYAPWLEPLRSTLAQGGL